MGTIAAPNIANIFVYCFEKSFLYIYRPLFYCRYIDDIFIILEFNFDINLLINSFPSLTLNVVSDEVVNFLQLNIKLCKLTGSLIFSLFYKPTNTFSYLLTCSNHPSHIFENIPHGLIYNAKRICSEFHDFLFHTRGFQKKKFRTRCLPLWSLFWPERIFCMFGVWCFQSIKFFYMFGVWSF